MSAKKKLIRITTIPQSLGSLLKGQPKFMSKYYDVVCVSSDGNGVLDKVAKEEGTRGVSVEMTRNITPIQDLKAVWNLYKIFRKEKPFIVHTHTPKAGTVGMLAAFLARVPYRLHTNAGLALIEIKGAKRMLLDFVEKFTYRCATKVYTNSFGLQDILIKNKYVKEEKLKVIGKGSSNGIDTTYFDPNLFNDSVKGELEENLRIKKKDYVFVFVGRLVKDKGINEMVAAFNEIASEHSGVKLLLVGPFEKSPENVLKASDALEPDTVDFIKTSEQVMAVGLQDDVRPYLAISDCLVFPSYREGFPNVVMQAGAMGLPTIASNINGCNELIIPDKNGVLIPQKNIPQLKKAMTEFLSKGKVNQENRTIIRNMIKDNYAQPIVWQAILNEYEELTNK